MPDMNLIPKANVTSHYQINAQPKISVSISEMSSTVKREDDTLTFKQVKTVNKLTIPDLWLLHYFRKLDERTK